ncbi:MAG TPA: class I SAM-dependent methyltransferase [Solirubrobacteraceae bacterium]|nr:class I SAM-dependent methyltransferase [Solirubrobacteraceae bacterium]
MIETALQSIDVARSINLDAVAARGSDDLANVWPGEHYRLLAALVACVRPKLVVEIGTATGLSALAMLTTLAPDARLVTFDLLPWKGYSDYTGGVLEDADFSDGRLEQRLDDLSTPVGWRANADLLCRADLIFVDAKHDGEQERRFLTGFDEVGLANSPIVVFDDTRVWGMVGFWQEIRRPKLDLTSFGHWSGTGLVDYA